MYFPCRHQAFARRIVTVTMILALLFAQGLRICIHAEDQSDSNGAQAAAVDVESALTDLCNLGTQTGGEDTPSSVILENLRIDLSLLFIVVALFVPFAPRQPLRPCQPRETSPGLTGGHGIRPPLRGPPR